MQSSEYLSMYMGGWERKRECPCEYTSVLFYFANLRFILSILRGSCKNIGGVEGIEKWKW